MARTQHWVMKMDTEDIKAISEGALSYSFEIGFNFQGKRGDKVIFLVRNQEWEFGFNAEISDQPKVEEIFTDFEKRLFKIDIKFNKVIPFDKPRLLNDFAYTITKVYKYDKPEKHFRTYTRISYRDYNAIVDNNVFISRTFFGKVANSLHPAHRMSFLKGILDEDPKLYTSGNDYYRAFTLLKDNIITPAQLLNEAVVWLDELDQEAKSLPLYFIGDINIGKNRELLNIRQKNEQINGFIKQEQLDFLVQVEKDIQEANESESNLNSSFTRRPLPIILE